MDGVSVLYKLFLFNLAIVQLPFIASPCKGQQKTLTVTCEGWTILLKPAGMHILKWHYVTPGP